MTKEAWIARVIQMTGCQINSIYISANLLYTGAQPFTESIGHFSVCIQIKIADNEYKTFVDHIDQLTKETADHIVTLLLNTGLCCYNRLWETLHK